MLMPLLARIALRLHAPRPSIPDTEEPKVIMLNRVERENGDAGL